MILLHGQHADELPAAIVEVAELEDYFGFQGTNDGLHDFAKMGQDAGIDGIGFGQLPSAFGEVAHLACIDDDGRQARGQQGADRGLLIRAGGFEDDALRREGSHPGDELLNALGSVVEAPLGTPRTDRGIQVVLADINADERPRGSCRGGHETSPVMRTRATEPMAFLFELMNAGLVPQ